MATRRRCLMPNTAYFIQTAAVQSLDLKNFVTVCKLLTAKISTLKSRGCFHTELVGAPKVVISNVPAL